MPLAFMPIVRLLKKGEGFRPVSCFKQRTTKSFTDVNMSLHNGCKIEK